MPLINTSNNKNKTMYLYAILNEQLNAVKIGYTKNDPNKRLSNLQVASPVPLKLIHQFKNFGKKAEKASHKLLQEKNLHISGEWFKWNDTVKHYLLDIEKHVNRCNFDHYAQHLRSWWESERVLIGSYQPQ